MSEIRKLCGIYKIVNIINNKIIIGQSTHIYRRWIEYRSLLRKNKWNNPYLQNAWNKYGEKNFKFEIILECPLEKLNEEEIRLIKEYHSADSKYGYNLTKGGNRPEYSKKSRLKMSESRKKLLANKENHPNYKKHLSEETKLRIGRANSGKRHWNFGGHWSEEIKQKLSEMRKGDKNPNYGKHPSLKTLEKMSIAHKGRVTSEETKQKIRAIKADKSRTNLGRHWSEETRKKMSDSHRGKKLSEETLQKKRNTRIRNLFIKSFLMCFVFPVIALSN